MKLIYIRSAVDSMDGTECARLVLWPETWAEISPAFLSRPVTGRLRSEEAHGLNSSHR